MIEFKRTNARSFQKPVPEALQDVSYIKNFKSTTLIKETGPIDYISVSPVEPHYFAVTSSTCVQIFNPVTKLVSQKLNKFKSNVYGGSFRKDGRLICVGSEESTVKLFDIFTKNSLRIFEGHTAPVHRTFFTMDGLRIISFCDDKSSILWDISTATKIMTFDQDHSDYIRAGAVSPISPHIFVSGGYDKIINMYDTRVEKKVFSVSHDAAVESIVFTPTGGSFLSAGGTEIRLYDCLSKGKVLSRITQHNKTVTSIALSSSGHKILSGSLDRHVKMHDAASFKTNHSVEYSNSITSLAISQDDKMLVVGMVDGMISIKEQKIAENDVSASVIPEKENNIKTPAVPVSEKIVNTEKEILAKYDQFLRKFQYSKALDVVMQTYTVNRYPHVSVALIRNLIRRNGLRQALIGRDVRNLNNIVKFCLRHFTNMKFGRVLQHCLDILLDVVEERIEENSLESRSMFKTMIKRIEEEILIAKSLLELRGVLESIKLTAETSKST
ncbi:U3 small nucleolar RNA-associated protein 15 homolog [Trichogramma pretiosum]|uniref:U3 small nucleolar RNA-associated protein 15 homolog n=1 Tax=Trichogramma pretiosum TaxID=7493 RepID=UPI0006C966B5|nr:U3 small nucleolar RNA-associated protein 15 homolog [Trichogramma pretiosum]